MKNTIKKILFLIAAVTLLAFVILSKKSNREDQSQKIITHSKSSLLNTQVTIMKPTSKKGFRTPAGDIMQGRWKEFQDKFGSELEAEFTSDGHLASVRGKFGEGAKATAKFDPSNKNQVIDRAREILQAAHEMLGIQAEAPLGNPDVNASSTSAQVFMRETYQGKTVSPVGNITMDLGPNGELVGLDSDYATQIHVGNDPKLRPEEAKLDAFGGDVVGQVKGGSPVIWVSGNMAWHAYEFNDRGYQVVVDAETGKVIFRRDRRQF